MCAREVDENNAGDPRSEGLFAAAQIPILIIDPDSGNIVDANRAAQHYYGYSHTQFTQLRVTDLNQLSEAEVLAEMSRAAQQQRAHFFFVHQLASGEFREVEVHSGAMRTAKGQYLYSIIHDITERRAAERNLAELNRDFITLLESTSDFIYFKDIESRFRFCSQTLADITGHESWRDMLGKHDLEVFPPDTAKIYYEEELPIFTSGEPLLNKVDPYYDEYDRKRWVNTNKWPVFNDEHNVVGLFGISRDVTEQQQTQEELRIAASVFDNVSEGLIVTDAQGVILRANQAFYTLCGYPEEKVLGATPALLNSGHHDDDFFQQMWRSLAEDKLWQGTIWNRHRDGSLFATNTSLTASLDSRGEIINYIGTYTDITRQQQQFEEVQRMAYYDPLTELPNRVLFNDRLDHALRQSTRSRERLAVCFLDLDKFKPVNDTYGHKVGDLLLVEVAERILQTIRESDTVARLGGDEFALILSGFHNTQELQLILERVLAKCQAPFNLQQYKGIEISASIGVCIYPDLNANAEQLLKAADKAMYQAKEEGRGRYQLYGSE
ncbi:MAG: diguanylate cyclase domain-containing protein [Pseudomonadales bacterium]